MKKSFITSGPGYATVTDHHGCWISKKKSEIYEEFSRSGNFSFRKILKESEKSGKLLGIFSMLLK